MNPDKRVLNGRQGHKGGRGLDTKPSGSRGADRAPARTFGFTVSPPPLTGLSSEASERVLFALNAPTGSRVEVQVKGGSVYEGILMGSDLDGKDFGVLLADAKVAKAKGGSQEVTRGQDTFIQGPDFVSMKALNVDFGGGMSNSSGFGTDAEISRGKAGIFGRELKKWAPAEGDPLEVDLDHMPSRGSARPNSQGWDQFQANEEKFNVRTSFNENIYTTKLDKSKSRISAAEAERIAAEIEGKLSSNVHLAEERGHVPLREQDEDEEAKYSSVARGSSGAALSADSQNADTFGDDTSPSNSSGTPPKVNGAVPRAAWSNAGASVAAVSGRPSSVKTSAPIDVDPRREHNKVRLQLTGAKAKDRSSPFGTPKGTRSPLSSPLVGNAAQVEALDLNPGTARYDARARSDFARFKKEHKPEGSAKSPSTESDTGLLASLSTPSTPGRQTQDGEPLDSQPSTSAATDTSRPSSSKAGATEGAPLGSRPGASHALQGALVPPQRGAPGQLQGRGPPPGPLPRPRIPHVPGFRPGLQMGPRPVIGSLPPGQLPSGPVDLGPIPGEPMPIAALSGSAATQEAPATRPASAQAPATSAGPAAPRPTTAALNPFAKEFKFNPAASSFTPGTKLAPTSSNASTAAASVGGASSATGTLVSAGSHGLDVKAAGSQPSPGKTVLAVPTQAGKGPGKGGQPGLRPAGSGTLLERKASGQLAGRPRSLQQGQRYDREQRQAQGPGPQQVSVPGFSRAGSHQEASMHMGMPIGMSQQMDPRQMQQISPQQMAHWQQLGVPAQQFVHGQPYMASHPMMSGVPHMAYVGGMQYAGHPGQQMHIVPHMQMSPPGPGAMQGRPQMFSPQHGFMPVFAGPQLQSMPPNMQGPNMLMPPPSPANERPSSSHGSGRT